MCCKNASLVVQDHLSDTAKNHVGTSGATLRTQPRNVSGRRPKARAAGGDGVRTHLRTDEDIGQRTISSGWAGSMRTFQKPRTGYSYAWTVAVRLVQTVAGAEAIR